MTAYARLVVEAIGHGFRLRVPFDGTAAELVNSYRVEEAIIGPLDASVVSELLNSGLLHRLAEHPEGSRVGWRGQGLNGEKAAFYCMVQ